MLFVALWHLLQVKAPNLLPAKEQVKAAIVGSRTEGHFLAAKGLTAFELNEFYRLAALMTENLNAERRG